jgi:hypothetical protein
VLLRLQPFHCVPVCQLYLWADDNDEEELKQEESRMRAAIERRAVLSRLRRQDSDSKSAYCWQEVGCRGWKWKYPLVAGAAMRMGYLAGGHGASNCAVR